MKRLIFNQKGFSANLAIIMVLVAVASSGMISLVNLIQGDIRVINWNKDKIQQELLLRSESIRMNLILQKNLVIIPRRTVEIVGRDRVATHMINHRRSTTLVGNIIGISSEAVRFEAMVTTKHSRQYLPAELSPVRSFMEKLSRRSSLAQYQYFSDKEMSDLTDDPDHPAARVKFFGNDELHGRVHSNDVIWIQNAGSAPVNDLAPGWPLFWDRVTTAKNIMIFTGATSPGTALPGTCPVDAVFRVGYKEEVPYIEYEPDATEIKRKGQRPFGLDANPSIDIIYADISGANIELSIGNIVETGVESFIVYDFYPDALNKNPDPNKHPNAFGEDTLWVNNITMRDTIWTSASSPTVSNTSIYLPATVWVKGTVRGGMTIGTLRDAFVIGHIQYYNTPLGQKPDDPDNMNISDFFGLVSESKILIKYKYRDPFTNEKINYPMSVNASGNTYLYGAFSAQGQRNPALGDFAYKAEGTFTYEYQHPYGSPVPFWGQSAKTGQDTLFANIPFHRFKFPPDITNTPILSIPVDQRWRYWPGQAGTKMHMGWPTMQMAAFPYHTVYDYPWINPVYPEHAGELVYLRGNLWVYGSIAQRRRGFIRRSGNMTGDNPDTDNYWDVDNYVLGPQHNATGYEKQYHYDSRFQYKQPPHYPEVYQGSSAGQMSAFDETTWNFRVPPRYWTF